MLPFPAGHQRPEDIKRLLEEAKLGRKLGSPPSAVLGSHLDTGIADDSMIEDAIEVGVGRWWWPACWHGLSELLAAVHTACWALYVILCSCPLFACRRTWQPTLAQSATPPVSSCSSITTEGGAHVR